MTTPDPAALLAAGAAQSAKALAGGQVSAVDTGAALARGERRPLLGVQIVGPCSEDRSTIALAHLLAKPEARKNNVDAVHFLWYLLWTVYTRRRQTPGSTLHRNRKTPWPTSKSS